MRKPEDAATIERELRAVDAALAVGEPRAHDPLERELQELALVLQDDRPRPDPDFGAWLGERVRAGFPPDPDSARGRVPARLRRLASLLRRPLPALGVAASLLLALVVAASLLESGPDGPATGDAPAPPAVQGGDSQQRSLEKEVPGGSAAPDSTTIPPGPVPPGGGGFEPGRQQRIERSASLTLTAPGDELDRVGDGINTVVDRHDGFVLTSSVTSGRGEGLAGGSFDLRIPRERLRPALRDLSGLATVRSRTQSGRDVTRQVVGARDRLDQARAERRSLLRRLGRADSDSQAEAIRSRLDQVASEIRGLRSQLRDLRLRTRYVAVSVTLEEEGRADQGGTGGTDEALDDFADSLVGSLNLALRVLGVLLPLAALGGLAWLAWRTVRRRRRESVLA